MQAAENIVSSPKDILVAGGKIIEIADAGTISRTTAKTTVFAEGLFALPGLIDVHAHIGDGGIRPQTEKDRKEALTQFVRYGVTTVFVPGGGGANDHQLAHWKELCDEKTLLCPEVYGSGALITARGSHPIGTIWDLPEDVDPVEIYERGAVAVDEETRVDSLIANKLALGVDAIKIIIEDWGGMVPRLSSAQISKLVQASHERGLQVFAHVSMPDHIVDGIANGVDGIMHSVEGPISDETLSEMAQKGIFFVSTLSLYDGFIDRALGDFNQDDFAIAGVAESALTSLEDFRFSPFETREHALSIQQILNENLKRADELGVPLALGTDANNPSVFPGYSVHEEMTLMVNAGLSPATVLEAATTGGALFLRKDSSLGRIEPGYEADILILKQNPLEDILNTRTLQLVIIDGRLIQEVVSLSEPMIRTKISSN